MQFVERSIVGVGLEVDHGLDSGEAGVALVEAEEGMEVEVAFKLDPQLLQFDSSHRGVGRVADDEAGAKSSQDLLDRIGGGVGAPESGRFVEGDRSQIAGSGRGPEGTVPGDLGFPY